MTIRSLLGKLFAALLGLAVLLLVGAGMLASHYAGAGKSTLNGALALYAMAGGLLFGLGLWLLWRLLDGRVLRPLDSLGRDVRTLLQAKRIDRALRAPEGHALGDLPESIDTLVDELRSTRREVVRTAASVTSRIAQQKDWLEVVLLELIREGVVMCNAEHRVLLYNRPAARLFHGSLALGLGRSLFEVVAEAPVLHALERLEFRRRSGRPDIGTPLVCATHDARVLLSARLALLPEEGDAARGYVLALEDISGEMAERRLQERVRRIVTRELRGPLASLRAAAEALGEYPDMEPLDRSRFHQVLLGESAILSDQLESLAAAYENMNIGHWPMVEIHSPDLFACVGRRLAEEHGIELVVGGDPGWLRGDSHVLLEVLLVLLRRLAGRTGETRLQAMAGVEDNRSFVELRWRGAPLPHTVLDEWLSEPISALSGSRVGELLEQHGCEPWSRTAEEGSALLHLPLLSSSVPRVEPETGALPSRPEFYDFDIMYDHGNAGELGARPLRSLGFVVFDTETTGLNPNGGDQIISIAGVRVTQGRVLEGETFESLIHPGRPIPKDSIRFHGITDEMVADALPAAQVLPRFHVFAGDSVLVAHNAAFDMKFLRLKEGESGVRFGNPVIDTLLLSLLIEGEEETHSLDAICERLDIRIEGRHSALGDALATAQVLVHLVERLEARGITTFGQVMDACNMEAQLRFRAAQF